MMKEIFLTVDMDLSPAQTPPMLPKKNFFMNWICLRKQYEKVAVYGRNRTCFSLLYESEPFYLSAVRDIYGRDLDEIVTDISEMHTKISDYLNEFQPEKLANT